MKIDKRRINGFIKDKYQIADNTFSLQNIKNAELDRYDGKPKDEINIEIGDSKQPDIFYPQVKLMRWSDEVNFSVRLKDNEIGEEEIKSKSADSDTIVWSKGNIDIEYYDYAEGEGGHKMVWYLKEKPLTNKVEFTIQSKGLDFFYQPPLTQEYQNGYSEEFKGEIVVTETQVKDLDGNVLVERPENVVGSYAVYHSTKGGMNDAYGKDYKTGQAFFIYRPHIIDANGAETWGILNIKDGIYSVEIPQEFLDKATFPIKSNDTFGYTTEGGTSYGTADRITGQKGTPSSSGTVTKISFYGQWSSAGGNANGAIYDTSYNIISNGKAEEVTVGGDSGVNYWFDVTFSVNPSVVGGTSYWVVDSGLAGSGYFISRGNSGGTNEALFKLQAYTNPLGDSISSPTVQNDRYYSIYATYTAGGSASASLSPSSSASPSSSNSPSISPSSSNSPSVSPSSSQSPSVSPSSSISPSSSASPSLSPSSSKSSSLSPSSSNSPSVSPSSSNSPSLSPSSSISPSSSNSPSISPCSSQSPSLSPSSSASPSISPSSSQSPSVSSSESPSASPSGSESPSVSPSSSRSPSVSPSSSESPSLSPSASLSPSSSESASVSPSAISKALYRWTGAIWAPATLYTYDGSGWVSYKLYYWSGLAWTEIDTTP